MKTRYHSAITGKFVTKEYAEANPETTVKISSVYLREELQKFAQHIYDNDLPLTDATIDNYIDHEV